MSEHLIGATRFEAPKPEELLLGSFQAIRRVDTGEHAWTYYAERRGRRAALKVTNPRFAGGFFEEVEAGLLNHPCIPLALDVGHSAGAYYYIREWVDGVTYDELAALPPSRENTTRLCRALLRLTQTVATLHRDGEYGPPRVHGALRGRDVIVTPEGDIRLINFDCSHVAVVPRLKPVRGANGPVCVMTDPEWSKQRDLDAVLALFRRLWQPFGASVVSFDALVPRSVADLRHEQYESVDLFRVDLENALLAAGTASDTTA